jgi:DNA-binding MurR/RpiR family transcriptional regulator
VLAVSFTPYNSITPELTASAAQRGVPIVSLTDSAFSPLAATSKTYLEVVEDDYSGFKSLSATLAVAMALVLRVAQLRGPRAEVAEPSPNG